MAANEVHKSDIGTVFVVTVKDGGSALDISGATTKEIFFQVPDGTTLTKTAAFTTDGTNGKIQYTTISGDLSVTGQWKLQAHVINASGEWRSDLSPFTVHENIV